MMSQALVGTPFAIKAPYHYCNINILDLHIGRISHDLPFVAK
jgi:hypothetical protein